MARAAWIAAALVAGCNAKVGDDTPDGDADSDSDSDSDTTIVCGEMPAQDRAAVMQFLADSGYEDSWPHEPEFDGIHVASDGFHYTPIQILVRPCVAETWGTGAERYPAGAMIVLQQWASAPPGIYLMYRISDEAGAPGWWWAAQDRAGDPVGEAGTDVGCDGCHSTGDDFVRSFGLDGV